MLHRKQKERFLPLRFSVTASGNSMFFWLRKIVPAHRFAQLAAASCTLALSACGGGGAGNDGTSPPQITAQPRSTQVAAGSEASFSISATGVGTPRFQWTRNGVAIPGATASRYVKPNVQPSDSGEVIRVEVTDSNGTTISAAATLSALGPGIHQFAGMLNPSSGPFDESWGSADGLAQEARFLTPNGLAMDAAGMLYIADFSSYTLRKVTPGGMTSTVAGMPLNQGRTDGQGAAARFMHPYHLAATRAGTVYLQDTALNESFPIRKINPDGTVTTLVLPPDPGETNADGTPAAVEIWDFTVDSADNLYVITRASMIGRCPPSESGPICAGTYQRHAVRKFGPGGAVTTVISTESMYAQTKHWFVPSAVASDLEGNLVVANGPQLVKISSTGAITPLAGDKSAAGIADGTGPLARFTSVYHMAFGPQGSLFVIDGSYVNPQKIRKISPTGVVTTVAGSEGAAVTTPGNLPGSLTHLSGLAIDSNGYLFVSTTRAILRIVLP